MFELKLAKQEGRYAGSLAEAIYLQHSSKGSERSGHKYIDRKWKNGRWQYTYNNTSKLSSSKKTIAGPKPISSIEKMNRDSKSEYRESRKNDTSYAFDSLNGDETNGRVSVRYRNDDGYAIDCIVDGNGKHTYRIAGIGYTDPYGATKEISEQAASKILNPSVFNSITADADKGYDRYYRNKED